MAVGIEVDAVATSGRHIDVISGRKGDGLTVDNEVTLTALPIEMFVERGVKMFLTYIAGMEIGNTDLAARRVEILPVEKHPFRAAVMVVRHYRKKVKRAFYHTNPFSFNVDMEHPKQYFKVNYK